MKDIRAEKINSIAREIFDILWEDKDKDKDEFETEIMHELSGVLSELFTVMFQLERGYIK